MKKLKLTLYSQRDSQWAREILGYNKAEWKDNAGNPYNLYWYGCLNTCYGMYLGKTPSEINKILKDGGGYQENSGNFIWGKSSLLGLNQIYVSPEYTGPVTTQGINKIKELIDNGYPLICKIDFNPATTPVEMHFVIINGYDGDSILAGDPWTGEQINLDVYGGAKRAIIQFRAYDKTLPFTTEVSSPELIACLADRESFWKQRDECQKTLNETLDDLEGKNKQVELYDKQMMQIGDLLGTSKDATEICGKITTLIAIEDRLRETQKELDDCKNNHTLKIKEWGTTIGVQVSDEDSLKNALHELVGTTDTLKEEKEKLEKELEQYKDEDKDFWQYILLAFNSLRKVNDGKN